MSLLGGAGAALATGWLPSLPSSALGGAAAGQLMIRGQPAELWVTPASPRTVRISLLKVSGEGRVQPPPQSLVLVRDQWPPPQAKLRRIGRNGQAIVWGNRTLGVFADPLRLLVHSETGELIQQLEIDSGSGQVKYGLGPGPVLGLGEGGPQFDRRGRVYPMKHGESVPDLATDGARLPIPWILSPEGWAIFFHRPLGIFDLTGSPGTFKAREGHSPLPLDMFLVAADKPAELLNEYARLTGFPHLPPVWSLGYQQSHRTLKDRDEVMGEAAHFRNAKLPCDVLIYLGTGFCPSGWNLGHGSYDFNPHVFPDPQRMIEQMHQEHFRIVLHEDKPPRELHGQVTDTGPAARDPEDAAAYWKEHVKVFALGVDGWWADEGDWLDNSSCLVRNRMYWQGAQQSRPNVRPYTLNRNGYAGTQRYGWVWSGDIKSTWRTLGDQIAVGLNLGLSGIPYWGTDTGGFVATPELTGELYTRWFQFSAFCPLFRSHGRTWKLRLPWGWDTGSYGPIESPLNSLPPLGDLHDARVEPICRQYLQLRMQLLPYIYTAVREAHETGLPMMRPVWLDEPEDETALEQRDEYLFGSQLLIAPVYEKGAHSRRLYLPRGKWRDFWTGQAVEGRRYVHRPVDLGTIPVYVRAGAVLPFGPVKQYITEQTTAAMTLRVYGDEPGRGEIYEDDGLTFDYRGGKFSRTHFTWSGKTRRLTLSRSGEFAGATQRFEVKMIPEGRVRQVSFERGTATVQL
jgi:alpha-glucosidase (family GH31 glycosyl hydrolase)